MRPKREARIADRPQRFSVEYLRAAADQPDIRNLKRRSYDLMQIRPGARVLDIGCGPGVDTVELAKRVGPVGRVVGIDLDPEMIVAADAEAAAAGVADRTDHLVGSLDTASLESEDFDACRCERVLQHVSAADGATIVSEARRVLRRGGMMVFIDTDWSTLSIHSPDVGFERELADLRRATVRNPFAARVLAELFVLKGVEVLHADVTAIHLSVARIDALLGPIARHAVASGTIASRRWASWRDGLVRAEERGTLLASVCMITCSGRVPTHPARAAGVARQRYRT